MAEKVPYSNHLVCIWSMELQICCPLIAMRICVVTILLHIFTSPQAGDVQPVVIPVYSYSEKG